LGFTSKILFPIIFLLILFILSLSIGSYKVYNPVELASILLGGDSIDKAIIHYRFWRTISALIVGLGLAISGLTIQRILNNPLADPYILGVSSGSALAYLIVLTLGYNNLLLWHVASFTGGLATYALVVSIATLYGLSSLSIIVAGVSITYLLTGITVIIISTLGPRVPFALGWLFGSVAFTPRDTVITSTLIVSFSLVIIAYYRGYLTSLLLGEEVSEAHGVNVRLLRLILSALVALIVSALVAVSGPVGFIGLAAPWLSRFIVGADFTWLLILSAIIGSCIGLGSDIVVRIIGGGVELPLTSITSIIGAPLLVYLSIKSRSVGRL